MQKFSRPKTYAEIKLECASLGYQIDTSTFDTSGDWITLLV